MEHKHDKAAVPEDDTRVMAMISAITRGAEEKPAASGRRPAAPRRTAAAPRAKPTLVVVEGEEAPTQSASLPELTPDTSAPHEAGFWTRAFGSGWDGVRAFAAATLGPAILLMLGAFLGGAVALIAFLSLTLLVFALDSLIKEAQPATGQEREFPAADGLSVVLAIAHFLMLPLAVFALAGGTGLGLVGWVFVFLGFGLWFGQVSVPNAHELIHRSDRRLYRIGMWIFISLLYGHHTSAHRLVHHRHVATPNDPNTADAGENFYEFFTRAWSGSFVAGYEMERNLSQRPMLGRKRARINPYLYYVAGGAALTVAMAAFFGLGGLLAYLLLCGHAQVQLLLSDYVQHYGLQRRKLPNGRYEPVGRAHSWDAPHAISALQMLNASRHADHHAHPSRPYPALRLLPGDKAPTLPYSLPVMATIALIPPQWFKLMDRRVRAACPPAAAGQGIPPLAS